MPGTPFELKLTFVDPPALELILLNASGEAQEFIDDWHFGMAPVPVLLDSDGSELPYKNVFPPITPAANPTYSKLAAGSEYREKNQEFFPRKGILYFHSEETKAEKYDLVAPGGPVPARYELNEPFAGYLMFDWSRARSYILTPGMYRAYCIREFQTGWKTLELPPSAPERQPSVPGGAETPPLDEIPPEPTPARWSGTIKSNEIEFQLPQPE